MLFTWNLLWSYGTMPGITIYFNCNLFVTHVALKVQLAKLVVQFISYSHWLERTF